MGQNSSIKVAISGKRGRLEITKIQDRNEYIILHFDNRYVLTLQPSV